MNIRIPADLATKLERLSDDSGGGIDRLVREAIDRYLAEEARDAEIARLGKRLAQDDIQARLDRILKISSAKPLCSTPAHSCYTESVSFSREIWHRAWTLPSTNAFF